MTLVAENRHVINQPSDYKCFNCQIPCVRGDPSLIRAVGNLYHKSCFKCNNCQISVIDKFFIMDSPTEKSDHIILCERDYYNNDSKCHHCNQAVQDNNYEVVGVYKYHRHCLHCPGCTIMKNMPSLSSANNSTASSNSSLSSIITTATTTTNDELLEEQDNLERFNYNNRPYCRYHYSLIKGTECNGCGQTVFPQQQQAKWHSECYMLMKYYQVNLNHLFTSSSSSSDIKSETQLFTIQNEMKVIRCKLWKETNQFEDTTIKIISAILLYTSTEKLYESCQFLYNQVNILFSISDLVFKYLTHLSCEIPTQNLSNQLVYFLDLVTCQQTTKTPPEEERMKLAANTLSQYTRELVKTSLQQTILLERNLGAGVNLIDQVTRIYASKSVKRTMDVPCPDYHLQLIDMSMTRLAFVLNIKLPPAQEQGKRQTDETILFKPTMTASTPRPTLLSSSSTSTSHQRMVYSTSNIHNYATNTKVINLKRSQSTTRKPNNHSLPPLPLPSLSSSSSSLITPTASTPSLTNIEVVSTPKNTSRMDSIRRALTTNRSSKKENSFLLNRSNSIFGINNSSNNNSGSRRDQRSFSLHNPSTPPLYISLPDVEQRNSNHTTPPLSPPTSAVANNKVWIPTVMPKTLPDLTQQQDCIIRHIAILSIESHAGVDNMDVDLLSILETATKKSSSSLWGKLKAHILTPSTEQSNPFNNATLLTNDGATTQGGEKKIGVSLCTSSSGSLNCNYKIPSLKSFENWKIHCPSIAACFSQNSFAPNFLKDCILAMIDQDVNTEGIFRKNGNIRGLKEMCDQLDDPQQQSADWFKFFKEQPIIQIAAFVKRYLRELPDPLLTYKLHKLFLMSSSNSQEDDLTIIHYAICMLPKINRDILLLVLAMLNWVARHSQENKMGYENLARVMAPNILYKQKQQACAFQDVTQCHNEIRIVALMIQYFEIFVKVPSDFTVLSENPKMNEYLRTNSIDLTCSKQFTKNFNHLARLKKDISAAEEASSILPPSPSTSTL